MHSTADTTAAPPRSRWQFSLRTLLVGMVVVGFGGGYLGLRMQRARQQEQIVNKILELKGTVLYHYQLNDQGKFDTRLIPSTPQWLRRILGSHFFDRPASVTLGGGRFADRELSALEELPSLENVYLVDTEVSQQGVDRLRKALPKAKIEWVNW